MRILVIQFVPATRSRPVPRFEPQLGILLALLKKRDHHLALLGLARFDVEATKAALARALPQLVYGDISGVCVDAARRTFEYLQQHEFLPIVVGGEYPTVDPTGSLSLPGVQAAAIGETDASLVTYFERMKDPAVGQVVPGVWLRDESGTARPDLPALVEDLGSLPFAERDLFGYAEHVRQTGQIEIAVGRGCPRQCAYCINDWLETIYEGHGTWVRRRTPENVLAEINLLRERYAGVRAVRFVDDAFALDAEWLGRFLPAYRQRCGLPFRCRLSLSVIEAGTVRALREAGCVQADVDVVSGSDFIRNEIFDMDMSGEQIEAGFALLKAAGIRIRAMALLGAPYESEASLADTRALLRRLAPDEADIRPYYPWPGTRALEICRDNGWLHLRGEDQYHHDRPGLDLPSCRPEQLEVLIRHLRQELLTAGGDPWWRRWSQASRVALGQIFRRS